MNSDEMWLLQLWSGAIGSFVAAVLGGLVALLVVRLANAQQGRHAAEAREVQALADVVAQFQSVPFQIREGTFDSDKAYLGLESALVRLELSGHGIQQLIEGMNGWSHKIALLGLAARDVNRTGSPIAADAKKSVLAATSGAAIALRSWSVSDAASREHSLSAITQFSADLDEVLDNAQQAGLVAGLMNSRQKPRPMVRHAQVRGSRPRS